MKHKINMEKENETYNDNGNSMNYNNKISNSRDMNDNYITNRMAVSSINSDNNKHNNSVFIKYNDADNYYDDDDDELFQTLLETGGHYYTDKQASKHVHSNTSTAASSSKERLEYNKINDESSSISSDNNNHYVDLGDMEFAHDIITSEQPVAKINCMNIFNALSYLCNACTAFFVGYLGLFGFVSTTENIAYEAQYQTLITPTKFTCIIIWIIIFSLDGLFSIVQLLPQYRARPIVRDGVGIMFFYSNIAQALLTVIYSFHFFFIPFLLFIYILVFLNAIFIAQMAHHTYHYHLSSSTTYNNNYYLPLLFDWFLLQFPFELKFGWVLYCTCVVFMQSLVAHSESASTQLTATILCFVLLTSISVFFLMAGGIIMTTTRPTSTTTSSSSNSRRTMLSKPNYTIPLVLLYSFFGTIQELHNPKDSILSLFGQDIVSSIRSSCIGCCIIIFCLFLLRVLISWIHRRYTIDITTF